MTDDELDLLLQVVRRPEPARATLEERVRAIEDRQHVCDLVMAYGWLCDRRRWDELLELYTDDVERILVGTLEERLAGKEALRERYLRPVLPRRGGRGAPPPAEQINTYEIRHLIHPPVVRISEDGDHAIAAAAYRIVATSDDGDELRRGEHEGGYIFELRRDAGHGWRVRRMTVISENARNPLFNRGWPT